MGFYNVRICLVFFCVLLLGACQQQKEIDLVKQIEQSMQKYNVPALQWCTFSSSGIIDSFALGKAHNNNLQKINNQTLFEVASLSKPVFYYLIQQLIQQEKLPNDFINTPLHQLIPKKFISQNVKEPRYRSLEDYLKFGEEYDSATIMTCTPKMLLQHSSGMGNWWDSKPSAKPSLLHKFKYSDDGYLFLQRIIEAILSKSLQNLLLENLPNELFFLSAFSESTISGMTASGHNENGEFVREIWSAKEALAHGTLACNAVNYAKFMQTIINTASLAKTNNKVHVENNLFWTTGWGLEQLENDMIYWHWGNDVVYQSFVCYFPIHDLGYIILTNSANGLECIDDIFDKSELGKLESINWVL